MGIGSGWDRSYDALRWWGEAHGPTILYGYIGACGLVCFSHVPAN